MSRSTATSAFSHVRALCRCQKRQDHVGLHRKFASAAAGDIDEDLVQSGLLSPWRPKGGTVL